MSLIALSKEYRESGEKCRKRLFELEKQLLCNDLTESQRLILQRKITTLSSMARDTIAISNYLENYYQGA